MTLNFSSHNSFTTIYRKKPYALIDPTQAKLSAAGKTILITAGHTGIGFSIAQNFGLAGASQIILLARRAEVLQNSLEKLSREHPKTKFHFVVASVGDNSRIKEVLSDIRAKISPNIDILVACAVQVNTPMPTLSLPYEGFAESIMTNVLGNAYLVREFLDDPANLSANKEKVIIDVSSFAAHKILNMIGSPYGVSKLAFTQWLAHLSEEVKGKGVKIYSMHPGSILTDAARGNGYDESGLDWDDAQLPGQFAVWLASEEANFLQGRFVWANWDVGELIERRKELEEDPDLLRIGLMH